MCLSFSWLFFSIESVLIEFSLESTMITERKDNCASNGGGLGLKVISFRWTFPSHSIFVFYSFVFVATKENEIAVFSLKMLSDQSKAMVCLDFERRTLISIFLIFSTDTLCCQLSRSFYSEGFIQL